jgi:hypothetical protein
VTDHGGGNSNIAVEALFFEDVPAQQCSALAQLGLSNVSITNIGDGTEVTFPTTGGAMTGNQPVQLNGNASGSALGSPINEPLTDFTGSLPEGDVTVASGVHTVAFADDSHVLASGMPEVAGQTLTVSIVGLNGDLTFNP